MIGHNLNNFLTKSHFFISFNFVLFVNLWALKGLTEMKKSTILGKRKAEKDEIYEKCDGTLKRPRSEESFQVQGLLKPNFFKPNKLQQTSPTIFTSNLMDVESAENNGLNGPVFSQPIELQQDSLCKIETTVLSSDLMAFEGTKKEEGIIVLNQ